MSGFIGTGLTGLLAAQRALQVTGNNIANANTDGYVRQRIDLAAIPSSSRSGVAIGQGVRVAGVERVFDQLLTDQLRDATAATGRSTAYNDLAVRLDRVLGDPERSIATSLRSFFAAVEAVGRDPTSIASRQQLLLEAGALGDRFAGLDNQLGTLTREIDARLGQAASTVNRLTSGIAELNTRIGRRQPAGRARRPARGTAAPAGWPGGRHDEPPGGWQHHRLRRLGADPRHRPAGPRARRRERPAAG
jgi:flagellar hook-associated protein 1 FlgK